MSEPIRWTVKQRYADGTAYIQWKDGMPLLFFTRKQCRIYIENKFAYIRTRKDLRSYPHNWRMPIPIKVKVILKEVKNG